MAPSLNTVAVLLAVLLPICTAIVELDDRFLERENTDDMWLIEFYAPWCGHCKKLEPIYRDVGRKLRGTSVKVGKCDVTKHSDMGKHYNVVGFPTIKFIKGDNVYTHSGDNTKNAIIEFVERVQQPAVQWLSSVAKLLDTRSYHSDGVFFLYVGSENEALYQKYHSAAQSMILEGDYYAGDPRIIEDMKVWRQPTILAFKDKVFYEFLPEEDKDVTSSTVEKWMKSERHTAFPQASSRTLFNMADSKRYLVLVIIDPHVHIRMDVNNRLKQVARNVALNHRQKYHSHFQFAWMSEPEMAQSITSNALSAPNLFVLRTSTRQFYIPPFHPYNVTVHSFIDYLDGVVNGTVPAQGGTGFTQRLKRIFRDIWDYLTSTWETSPWAVVLIILTPCGILSAVVWNMFGQETMEGKYWKAFQEMEKMEKKAAELMKEQRDTPAEKEKTEGKENEEKSADDKTPADSDSGEKDEKKEEEEEKKEEKKEEGGKEEKQCCTKPKGREEKKND